MPRIRDDFVRPSVVDLRKIRRDCFTYLCELSGINRTVTDPPLPMEYNMFVFKNFLHDESGATAIEYGLIAAGISVAIIATVNTLGSQLKNTFNTVSTQLGTAGK